MTSGSPEELRGRSTIYPPGVFLETSPLAYEEILGNYVLCPNCDKANPIPDPIPETRTLKCKRCDELVYY